VSRIPDIDWGLDGYRGVSWDLGNDTDCETCGITWNRAEFDPDFQGLNKWSFNYNTGCYHGDSLHYDDENTEQRLAEMFKYLRTFPGWPHEQEGNIRNMIKECDKAREQK
jgi:hypothetical protein